MKIILTKADMDDLEDLYNWRNNPTVRKSTFNQKLIPKKEHYEWLTRSLKNDNRTILIANIENHKIGQIRFDKINDYVEVDISIDPIYQGKGYGYETLKKGCEEYSKYNIIYFIAKIKKNNIQSINVFEKCGFNEKIEFKDHFLLKKKRSNL